MRKRKGKGVLETNSYRTESQKTFNGLTLAINGACVFSCLQFIV